MFAFLKPEPALSLAEFEAVLARRSARWYSACLRITRQPALAEDAVQDALLKAWHRRGDFRGEAQLDTWIHRIAIHAAIDLMRRERPGLALDAGDALATALAPDDPEAAQHSLDLARGLDAALDRLTAMERLSFVLKHVEEWRLSEIAAELELSLDSVKQALFRALRKLRPALEEHR